MNINEILNNLIKNPYSANTYRKLKEYYHEQQMDREENAFTLYLKNLIKDNDFSSDSNKE